MNDHPTGRLSDYLDGELEPAERQALEAHLASCAPCAATLGELRAVVARAAALTPSAPQADLWPGIQARIARRFSFTMPQLVAAGLALVVMSGGGVWVLKHGGAATDLPPVAATGHEDPAAVPPPDSASGDSRTDETVPVQRGASLLVTNYAGAVVIHGWDTDAVHVEARHQPRTRVSIRPVAGGLTITAAPATGSQGPVDYDITAPAWMPIRVEGTSDAVTLDGAHGSAGVSLETFGGSIRLRTGSAGRVRGR